MNNRALKRFIAFALAVMSALPFTGCRMVSSGADVCLEFMEYIQNCDYYQAYELISDAVRREEKASGTDATKTDAMSTEKPDEGISKSEFVNKYTSIFRDLEISSVEYSDFSATDGEIMVQASYTAVYSSAIAGDMVNDFEIVAVRESGKWQIEWTPALIFPEMEWGDSVRMAKLSATRGDIVASGEVLATNIGLVSVYASPSKIADRAVFISRASALLAMTSSEVEKKLDAAYGDMAVLKTCYPDEIEASVIEQLTSVEGMGVDSGNINSARYYPYGSTLAHTVGYVGPISAKSTQELNELISQMNEAAGFEDAYNTDSIVGKTGLEYKFETQLRGVDGMQIYIGTYNGYNRRTLYTVPAQNGMDVVLSIDLDLQMRTETVMKYVLFGDSTAGAVVVMNPKTGEIEAMASYPSYDVNLFTRGISESDYSALLNNAAKPLINRVTQGTYPPGSVLKAFTAAAALESGALDTDFVFTDTIEEDYWTPSEFGEWIWPPIKRTSMRVRPTPLNMHNAIISSDNIYFAYAAMKTGGDAFMAYMKKLGMEEAVPFDINVARAQLINESTELTEKLLADSGYGQGEILVTPLQLASMFSAYANGGDIPVPRIVSALYRVNGIKYDTVSETDAGVWKKDVIADTVIAQIEPMLKDVTNREFNGTGRDLKARNATVAAKTGTAEIGNDKTREISWFVGYRTDVSDDDARLVLVMLEVPSTTKFSKLKFDIARELLSMKEKEDDPNG